MKHNVLGACMFVLFLGLVASEIPALAQEKKKEASGMYYTVDWSKWDKPDDKGRQIIVVIHNSHKGDYQHIIKVQKDTVTTVSSQHDKDGNKVVVVFDVPAKLTRIPKRLKVSSVKWNGAAVPSEALAAKAKKDKGGKKDP